MCKKLIPHKLDFYSITLLAAALYNFLWGSYVILFPELSFTILGVSPPKYKELWQCIGMIVGVYGIGYYIAAFNPRKHWPIVLVGFLGKVFGPIGFIGALIQKIFPLSFGLNIIFNDLIWWIPFFLTLKYALTQKESSPKIFETSDLENLEKRYRVKLINSLSGFKSANLIGTVDENSITNLSIVSSVFHLGAEPPLIGMIIRPDTAKRDTLDNIRKTKQYTINHVNEDIFFKAHQTSARYDSEQSEFSEVGLTEAFRNNFIAPFVKESYIKIGVKLIREEKIIENGAHLIIGEIVYIEFPEHILEEDGHLDINEVKSVAVSGLDEYQQAYSLGRLQYAKKDTTTTYLDRSF